MSAKDVIVDHYKNPRNYGIIDGSSTGAPVAMAKSVHGSCGDQVTIYLVCNNGIITDIRFEGSGCMISQAAASLLTEQVKNMSCSDAQKLTEEDVKKLLVIPIGPVRMRCALVALDALHKALALC